MLHLGQRTRLPDSAGVTRILAPQPVHGKPVHGKIVRAAAVGGTLGIDTDDSGAGCGGAGRGGPGRGGGDAGDCVVGRDAVEGAAAGGDALAREVTGAIAADAGGAPFPSSTSMLTGSSGSRVVFSLTQRAASPFSGLLTL